MPDGKGFVGKAQTAAGESQVDTSFPIRNSIINQQDNSLQTSVKNLNSYLHNLSEEVKKIGNIGLMDRCDTLIQEYRYMLSFIASGGKDENRKQFIDSLFQRVACLNEDVERVKAFASIPGYESVYAQIKEIDTSSTSLIDALNDKSHSPEEHFNALSNAFCALLFSYGWSQKEQRLWTAFLISSETDVVDAQTLVSAIMLSCRIRFCIEKFRTLAYVYLTSDNDAVRQRALVGWCVNLQELKDKSLAAELFDSEETRREVLKLMMQMVASTNADKDGERIKREIMPELLKHQIKNGMLSDDMLKSNDDIIADVLNPGREEQEMEAVEKSIGKMTDMMKNGADVFFGEFSKMKRYPFFYKPVNWFMPFVYEHPLLADARKKLNDVKSLSHIFRNGPFCDSDKYSFTFGLSSVISSLPEKVREMLSTGEVGPLGTLPQGSEREITPDYLRRMYLQDLYRFYNLSPQLKLSTIFTKEIFMAPFRYSVMNPLLLDFGRFLVRNQYLDYMEDLISLFDTNSNVDKAVDYLLLCATYYRALGNEKLADDQYKRAYKLEPENETALRGHARYSLILKDYESAASLYDILHEKHPDNLAIAQNRVLAKVGSGKASEVINEIYRLDIELENNLAVKRLLAWVLLCSGRIEQCEAIYAAILSGEYGAPSPDDRLSYAEMLWVSDRTKEAIECVSKLLADNIEGYDAEKCTTLIEKDIAQLNKYYKVYPADASLIVDAALLL